jgi:branched-chain amino acid aminotransferase
VVEKDIDLFDAYTADEAFLTSTSLCICPVQSINGAAIGGAATHGAARVPGPVTRQLTDAYRRFVDHDFVAQYLKRLE